jgi:hypothetical protein
MNLFFYHPFTRSEWRMEAESVIHAPGSSTVCHWILPARAHSSQINYQIENTLAEEVYLVFKLSISLLIKSTTEANASVERTPKKYKACTE